VERGLPELEAALRAVVSYREEGVVGPTVDIDHAGGVEKVVAECRSWLGEVSFDAVFTAFNGILTTPWRHFHGIFMAF